MSWTHRQSYEAFEDFDMAAFVLTDAARTSLDANLSFDCERRLAHVTLTWNTDEGEPKLAGGDEVIDWDAAVDLVRQSAPQKVLARLLAVAPRTAQPCTRK